MRQAGWIVEPGLRHWRAARYPRIVNGTIDIGAFEVQSNPLPGFDSVFSVLLTAEFERD
jgi:hypothetical protein